MSKSEERRHRAQAETQDVKPEQPYSFPTIGDAGITVMASSQEEAVAKAMKIKESLEGQKPLEKPEE